MGLILRCIDFLRECNRRLRPGEALGSAPELLEELNALNSEAGPPRRSDSRASRSTSRLVRAPSKRAASAG